MKTNARVANPYLPIWEHIPDGEPRIFKDRQTGEPRLYVYGSHDSRMDRGYCGPDHVAWSAPPDDLTDWRFEGELIDTSALIGVSYIDADGQQETIVESSSRVLYAPDVIYDPDDETYYMFLFPSPENKIFVAASKSPAGPFTDPKYVCDGFDPAALVDDELDEKGRHKVYLYYSTETGRDGFACRLDPENGMRVIPETMHYPDTYRTNEDPEIAAKATMLSKNLAPFHFFEGPSIRKVNGWYILSYQRSAPTNPENTGIGKLAEIGWAYSKNPFGDPGYADEARRDVWHFGGVIVSNLGERVADPYAADPGHPEFIDTFYGENTHGGMVQVHGQWYQVYHRATGNNMKRQSLIEPFVMRFAADDGHPIIEQAEMTSQGVRADGLDPYQTYYAAIACYEIGGRYVRGHWGEWTIYGKYPVINCTTDGNYSANGAHGDWYPVEDIRSRTWLGYKYFNFGEGPVAGQKPRLVLSLKECAPATVRVYISEAKANYSDAEKLKTLIGSHDLPGVDVSEHEVEIPLTPELLRGKKGVYLEFVSDAADGETELVKLNKIGFRL